MKRALAHYAPALAGCVALGAACVSVGCIGDRVWAKANAAYAGLGDYERAESACRHNDGLPDVAAGPRYSPDFLECMRGHGWVLVRRP